MGFRGARHAAGGACFGALASGILLIGLLLSGAPAMALTQRGHVSAFSFGSKGSGAGQLELPQGVAVNETTGEAAGDIYVVDSGNNRIDRFDAEGKFISAWGWGVADGAKALETCTTTCQAGLAGKGKGQLFEARGIAVDNSKAKFDPSAGDVYVEANTSEENAAIDKFSPTGTLLQQIKGAKEAGESIEDFEALHGVAVDTAGTLWIYDEKELFGFSDDTTGKFLTRVGAENEGEGREGLAIDAQQSFYVGHEGAGANTVIAKLEMLGEPLGEELDGEESTGVAVDTSSNEAFVDNQTSVAVFGSSEALLERLGAGVLHEGTGLAADARNQTLYVADAATGQVDAFAPEPPAAPVIDEASVSKITAASAVLNGQINPRGLLSGYFFRFDTGPVPGASQACTAPCVQVPAPSVDIGAGFGDVPVEVHLQALAPSTTYDYRAFAVNSAGSVEGDEQTFTTQSATTASTLPDGRVWELVSPQAKNGAAIEAITHEGGVIEASEDGTKLTYVASGPIAGAEGSRNPEFTQILSSRGATEWSSRDLSTQHESGEGLITGSGSEYRFFSSDLSLGLVTPFGETPLEAPPLSTKATERTPYLRQNATCDLAPAGCFEPLLTPADVPPKTEFGGAVQFVSATSDLAHVVLSAKHPLSEEEAAKGANLYEWTAGRLQLINVLPESTTPAAGAELGSVGRNVRNAISSDGSRVFWTDYSSGVPEHLYMRDLAKRETVEIDAPEAGQTELGTNEHDLFQLASSDGSRVFFTDEQRLTAESTAVTAPAGKADLYECEIVENEAGHLECKLTDLSVDENPGESADVQGLAMGAGEEGNSVYFLANGVLAAGATPGHCRTGRVSAAGATCNLYVKRYDAALKAWGPARLIAVLSAEDLPDWFTSAPGDLATMTSRVSPDGNRLAFMSDRRLSTSAPGGHSASYNNADANSGKADEEVYLYDAPEETLICASCNPTGARPVGLLDAESAGEGIGPLVDRPLIWTGRWLAGNLPGWTGVDIVHALYQSRYLSDSGRLMFDSPDALVPQDSNGKEDAYEYEPAGVGDCSTAAETYSPDSGGCVGLISSGTSPKESAFLDASADGNDAFFVTAAPLVSLDQDTSFDIYDAGICGQTGTRACLPAPASSLAPCATLDACRPAPSVSPSFATDASATSAGSSAPKVLASQEAKPKAKTPTRAQRYAKALKACKKIANRKKRAKCDAAAKKSFGPIKKKAPVGRGVHASARSGARR